MAVNATAARHGDASAMVAAAAPSPPPPLALRIVDIQHAQAKPLPGLDPCFSPLTGEALELVPVIRIYGATPAGQKACLHLHGVLPYFYIPYDEDLPLDQDGARAWLRDLARGIDLAMQIGAPGNAAKRQRVFGVTLVRARPFYGFHANDAIFVKVMLLNPRDQGRAAMLLQGGGIMGRRFQPYESHIPYLLQFKVEYNLYGMGFVRLRKARFRGPLPVRGMTTRAGWDAVPEVISYEEASTGSREVPPPVGTPVSVGVAEYTRLWTAGTTPADWRWGPQPYGGRPPARVSTCELEMDAVVEDILNRAERLRVPLSDAPRELRLVESLGLMWEEERQRCGGQDPPPQPPDPPRTPKPLCLVVDYVRSQFQAIADQQAAAAAAAAAAAQPGSQQSAGSAASHGFVNLSSSSARSASASPARHALLAMTQAANLAASGDADLSAGSGHGAASGSTDGAGASQGQQQGSGQQGRGGAGGGAALVDEAIVSMTQAAAARPGRQRLGVSQFLQHVAAGGVAAFDADGAIPEGDEEEDAASEAGLSDAEGPAEEATAGGNAADAADAAAAEAFPDGMLTALLDAAGPSQGSASQDPELRRAASRDAAARRESRDCEDILAATQAEAAAPPQPAAAEAQPAAAAGTTDVEDVLGEWAGVGLDSQEWADYRVSQATPQRGTAAAATATTPQQQQFGGNGSIPQVDGAPDSAAGEQLSPAAVVGVSKSRVWLPAPTRYRVSHIVGVPMQPVQARSSGAAVLEHGTSTSSSPGVRPHQTSSIPQVDGAGDEEEPRPSPGRVWDPKSKTLVHRRPRAPQYGAIQMTSSSPSASARTRSPAQQAGTGIPPQLTPQSRPPPQPPDTALASPRRSPKPAGNARRALDFDTAAEPTSSPNQTQRAGAASFRSIPQQRPNGSASEPASAVDAAGEHSDDIEVELSQASTELASPFATPTATQPRSASPPPVAQLRDGQHAVPGSFLHQSAFRQVPTGQGQGQLQAMAADAVAVLPQQAPAPELRLQLSPSDSVQRVAPRLAGRSADHVLPAADAAAQSTADTAAGEPTAADGAGQMLLADPAGAAIANARAQPDSSDGAPLNLYMDLSSSDASAAGSPDEPALAATAKASPAANSEDHVSAPQHGDGTMQTALSLQLSVSSSGGAPSAAEAEQGTMSVADSGPQTGPQPLPAADVLLTGVTQAVPSRDADPQRPSAPAAVQQSQHSQQPPTSQRATEPGGSQATGGEQAASSPVQGVPVPQADSPQQPALPAASQPAEAMDADSRPDQPSQQSAAVPAASAVADEEAHSPARKSGIASSLKQPDPPVAELEAAAIAALQRAPAAAATQPQPRQGPENGPEARPAAPGSPRLSSPSSYVTPPPPQAAQRGLASSSGRGSRPGSRRRSKDSTPTLQLSQRVPSDNPQQAARLSGSLTAIARAAAFALSSDGRASPSSSLGQPLRLSPLGSQHRVGHSSQPPPPAGLDEERAAGLQVFAPQRPPPTQAELAAGARSRGGLRVTQRGPFYGNPAHAPLAPIRSAGLEFRVPTSAVSELPHFSGEAATLQVPSAARNGQPPQRRWFEFAPRPPPRAVTDAWLAAQRAPEESELPSQQQPQQRRGLVMDPNTGAYRPAGVASTPGTQQHVGGSGNFRSSPGDACVTPHPSAAAAADAQEAADQDEEEFRPPSPKYDERSFFFSAVHPWAVRTPSRTQRQRRNQAPRPTPESHAGLRTPVGPLQRQVVLRPGSATSTRGGGGAVNAPQSSSSIGSPPAHLQQGSCDRGAPTHLQAVVPPPDPGNKRPAPTHPTAAPPPALGAPALPRAPAGAGASPLKRRRLESQLSPAADGGSDGGGAPTPLSQAGFKRLVPGKGQCLTLLSVEITADCRGRLLPDPRYDAVRVIALATLDDAEEVPDGAFATRCLLHCADAGSPPADALHGIQVNAVATEMELLDAFVDAVRALDPDILVGYDVRKGSFGYLIERAATMDVNLPRALSRTPEERGAKEGHTNEYDELHAAGIDIPGRLTLNLWRLLRTELKLGIYTQESTAAAVLQRRLPRVPPHQASLWFAAGPAGGRWRAVNDAVRRARTSLALIEQLDLVGRTGETGRAFGIDFLAVLYRGSQYRVESLMARLAHSQNYLLPSPSKEQVGTQPAMEAMPLVMEPESRFYADGPVVVLDFQSLYPSQIIAYNLCFSTCLGRPAHAAADTADPDNAPRLGALSLALPDGTLVGGLAPDKLVVAPNGVAFAPASVRPGVLPRMLDEILSTRIMVKAAMKRAPAGAKVLQRVLNARQFCLKLIANVTYGYAAAGFSGRMPMAELADAIVQSGRETLENAIRMVNAKPEWAAHVVYGDTDSLFVHLPGRSRAEAWRIGAEIAAQVTAANPPPVTLKLEKVYDPCTLLTKKRYAGYMYESPHQASPAWDAKGIETVRRDGCPAVVKIQERAMRTLFETSDLSAVRAYLQRQWTKILAGRVSLQDFVFAKEVRLGTYINAPPAACVAARAAQEDPRAEPAFGERVPYVVVCGAPSSRLMDVVVAPRALVEAGGRYRLNAQYYITKQINPAIARVLQLVGADVPAWFATMPRPQRRPPQKRPLPPPSRRTAGTIDRYYLSSHCAVCDALTRAEQPLCPRCLAQPQLAVAVLQSRASGLDAAAARLVQICGHCGGDGGRAAVTGPGGIVCDSLDCAAYFERRKTVWEAATARAQLQAALAVLPG